MSDCISDSNLRNQVYIRLRDWGVVGLLCISPVVHLSQLMGRKGDDYFSLGVECTERERNLCHLLLSEHGLTIYKMLVLRQEHVSDE